MIHFLEAALAWLYGDDVIPAVSPFTKDYYWCQIKMEDVTFVSEEDQEGTIGIDDNNEEEVERALCQWNWNQAATLASAKAKSPRVQYKSIYRIYKSTTV